jgi:signal transduction histidine kinase
VKVSELSDQHGHQLGRVLVLRDITDRTNRRQQLQVLNRVLLHNFRNDMNVIDVCATQLVERLEGEEAELASRVRTVARDLTETGTKAREIEQIMSRRHNDPQPIDLPSLMTRQLDTLRHEYPEAEIEADLPESLEIRSTGILESVLENVLENAIVHNDSERPHVWVTVDADDDTVDVAVADDGPGIPRQERDVLVKGTETPLEHGSGLGLWLVNWGVSMLGGEIEFRDRVRFGEDEDVRGSVVTISIPRSGPTVHSSLDRSPIDAD